MLAPLPAFTSRGSWVKYIYVYIYIYIYICHAWLRANGVSTNGVAAKVNIYFCQLGEKVRPGTFGKIQVGQREYPTSTSCNKT